MNVSGEEKVLLGRGGQAAGVVVGQDHHGGVQGQGLGGDLPQADLVGVGGALAEGTHAQELALAVEAGQEGLLVPGPKEVGGEQGVKGGTVREDHLRAGAGGQVPGSDGGDQLEEDHRIFPHAGDLAQIIGGGVQHPRQGTEGVQQLMGQGVHIPLAAGVEEEELQHPGF